MEELLAHPHDRRHGGVVVDFYTSVDECVGCGFRGYVVEFTEEIRYCRRCLRVALSKLGE